MKQAALLIIFFLALVSCEGVRMTTGTVVSRSTGLPIENADIIVLNHVGESTVTDSLGMFTLNTGFTGMMFGGPKFEFQVSKAGYKSQRFKTRYTEDTIQLETE